MSKHRHVAGDEETVLYACTDGPTLRAFDLYREYDGNDDPVDLPKTLGNHDEPRALMDD